MLDKRRRLYLWHMLRAGGGGDGSTTILAPGFVSPSLTFTRASSATDDPTASGTLTTYGTNVLRDGGALGVLLEGATSNLLTGAAAPATQGVTVAAAAHALSFYGTGTVTLSGASTAGPLVGTGANNRVVLLFTPTAGTLTLTVSGSVTNAQLEANYYASSYLATARAVDLLTLAGTGFTDLFGTGAPQGVVVCDVLLSQLSSSLAQAIASIDIGNDTGRVILYNAAGTSFTYVTSGVINAIPVLPIAAGTRFRVGMRWTSTTISVCLNGATPVSQTITLPTGINIMRIGNAASGLRPLNSRVSLVKALGVAPSDAVFQAMCTP